MPRKRKPKPSTAWPMFFTRPRRAKKDIAKPTPTSRSASSWILKARSWTVKVVPMSAPRMMPSDWRNVIETGRDEADQHQRGRRGGLDERGHQRARAHRGEAGPRHAGEEVAQVAARRALQALAGELHAVEQQGQAAEQREQRHGRSGAERARSAAPSMPAQVGGVVHREHARRRQLGDRAVREREPPDGRQRQAQAVGEIAR